MNNQHSPVAQATTFAELAELVKARKKECGRNGRAVADLALLSGGTVTREPLDAMPNDYAKLLVLRAMANKLRRELEGTQAAVVVGVDGIRVDGLTIKQAAQREAGKLGALVELAK